LATKNTACAPWRENHKDFFGITKVTRREPLGRTTKNAKEMVLTGVFVFFVFFVFFVANGIAILFVTFCAFSWLSIRSIYSFSD
jgi:hypothetical protein